MNLDLQQQQLQYPYLKRDCDHYVLHSSYTDVFDHILCIPAKPTLLFSLRTHVQIELTISEVKAYFSLSPVLSPKFEIFSGPQLCSAGLHILLYIFHPLFVMFNQYLKV